ncbi:hypothetical protein RYZ26_06040 [Terasakiella sp. A23]|nr:hypothetical protein [Terasakiella sp. A23]MDV7339143.1 hypothetical protein [Terasakiella sp. A23]
MLSDKRIDTDLRQNPGMIIGKDEMAKFLDFVKTIVQKEMPTTPKAKIS